MGDARRGSVLIYVVWTVLLLSIFAGGVGVHALSALNLTERMAEQLRASQLAQSGALFAKAALDADATEYSDGPLDPWANDPMRFRERAVAGGAISITRGAPSADGQVRYGLSDEESKLNLNTATLPMLRALIQRVGRLDEDDAQAVAAAIVDWRDEDTDESDGGAENFYYQTQRPGYDCHDAPFEHPEELLLVKGMTPKLYKRLAPHVTTYGSGRLNLNTATWDALASLGLSESGRGGLLLFRSGEDGIAGNADDRQLETISQLAPSLEALVPAEDLAVLQRLVKDQLIDARSSVFAARIEAGGAAPADRMSARVVLDRDGRILIWDER